MGGTYGRPTKHSPQLHRWFLPQIFRFLSSQNESGGVFWTLLQQRNISRDVRRTRFFEKIEFEVLRGNLTRLSRIPFPNRMCTWKVWRECFIWSKIYIARGNLRYTYLEEAQRTSAIYEAHQEINKLIPSSHTWLKRTAFISQLWWMCNYLY